MRPFLDQAIQLSPDSTVSSRFSTRMIFGGSAVGGFATLQTLKSPSAVCIANMSDFCLVEDECHARWAMGDGARGTGRVCNMVKVGRRATSKIEPLRYLVNGQLHHSSFDHLYAPNGVSLAICCRRNCCNRIEDRSCRDVL